MDDRGDRPSRTRGAPTLTGHRWPPAAWRAPFVALALCASPLLNFGVANGLDHRDYAVILAVILAFFGGCLAFAALAHFVGGRFDMGLISAASFVMSVFLFSDFSRALRSIGSPRLRLILTLWLAASITLVVLVRRLWTIRGGAAALQLLSLTLLVSPVVLSLGASRTPGTEGREVLRTPPMTAPPPSPASGMYHPNVYLISHDSYLRADALSTFYGFDNRSFTDRLSALGFLLPSRSYSNYNFTIPSLSTTLGMNYVVSTESEREALLRGGLRTEEISGASEVAMQFKRRGYTYIFANNGFFGSLRCSAFNDVCLNPRASSYELYAALVDLTPAQILAVEIINRAVYSSFTVDRLTDFEPRKQRQPFLFVLHTVGLHNFDWAADCRYRPPTRLAGWLTPPSPALSLIKRAYVDQIQCVNRMTLAAVESLLARDPEAIMIIQGDHGTWSMGRLRSRPRTDWMATPEAEELFAILNAYRLPARCRRRLYDTISPVNSFRVVLSCIDDTDYPLLPDRHFLMSYPEWNGHPFFEEVSFNGHRP